MTEVITAIAATIGTVIGLWHFAYRFPDVFWDIAKLLCGLAALIVFLWAMWSAGADHVWETVSPFIEQGKRKAAHDAIGIPVMRGKDLLWVVPPIIYLLWMAHEITSRARKEKQKDAADGK